MSIHHGHFLQMLDGIYLRLPQTLYHPFFCALHEGKLRNKGQVVAPQSLHIGKQAQWVGHRESFIAKTKPDAAPTCESSRYIFLITLQMKRKMSYLVCLVITSKNYSQFLKAKKQDNIWLIKHLFIVFCFLYFYSFEKLFFKKLISKMALNSTLVIPANCYCSRNPPFRLYRIKFLDPNCIFSHFIFSQVAKLLGAYVQDDDILPGKFPEKRILII